jgi:hypothetical protein
MMHTGVLTVAQNSNVDYIRLAYLQRQSLLTTNPGVPYAVVTDEITSRDISSAVRDSFDHVIVLQHDLAQDQQWKQKNESQLFWLTPFRETIKVEADLLFTGSISHWWTGLRLRDIVISQGCVDYQGRTGTSRVYRKLFDANGLPDLYTGLMYWRRSHTAQNFFRIVQDLHEHWPEINKQLTRVDQTDPGSNDMVFALAAKIFGVDQVTAPLPYFRMAHLKPAINNLSSSLPWHQQLMYDYHLGELTVAGRRQTHPVHYHEKDWANGLV